MNNRSLGLIIFSFIALAAVFAFIFIFGGPETTGDLSASQKIGTSWYKYHDAFSACEPASCRDGLPGIPTGVYAQTGDLYQCRCQTSDPTFVFWRSPYTTG